MLETHKSVLFGAAQRYTCWIGVREPNALADKWIGRAGHVPKPVHCKAKTADNPSHPFGGLVVDPTVCPKAFKSSPSALAGWKLFAPGGRLPAGYSVAESGKETGLVQYQGGFIHADYDLMALVRSNAQGEFLRTSDAEQRHLFASVASALNRGFGAPLIQHGAEFMWSAGVGARESEFVLWFGVGRRFNRWPSSMPRGGH